MTADKTTPRSFLVHPTDFGYVDDPDVLPPPWSGEETRTSGKSFAWRADARAAQWQSREVHELRRALGDRKWVSVIKAPGFHYSYGAVMKALSGHHWLTPRMLAALQIALAHRGDDSASAARESS